MVSDRTSWTCTGALWWALSLQGKERAQTEVKGLAEAFRQGGALPHSSAQAGSLPALKKTC